MGITNWGVDFSDVEVKDFGLVPDGTYHASIETHRVTKSQKGDDILNFQFDILDEEVLNGDNKPVKVRGRKLFDSIPVMPSTAWRYKLLCRAAGFDDEAINSDTPEPEELYGSEVTLVVGHRPIKRQGVETDELQNTIVRIAKA